MCLGCYEDYGFPTLATPEVIALASMLHECDEFGNLHIIISDWNLEDDNIEFCAQFIEANPNEERPGERECLIALASATMDERASAMAISDGVWRLDAKDYYGAE